MAVSRRLRFEILRRDGHTCRYCGASAPDVKLTVDHVNPSALGGEDRPENLVTACDACNGGKSSIPPDSGTVANVAADAVRWSAAIQAAAEQMLADRDQMQKIITEFDEAWSVWGAGSGSERAAVPRPAGWEQSVGSFMAAGLPQPVLLDCIPKAMGNRKLKPDDVFRYMCGIAWKKVGEIQDAARRQLATEVLTTGAGRTDDYELMYRELIGWIFGCLWGVGSDEDVQVLAGLRREALEEDEEPTALDAEGLAAVELICRNADLICEAHTVNQRLLADLAPEKLGYLQGQASGLNDWPEEMESLDRGVLYREYITACMAKYHLYPELQVEAWNEAQADD